MGWTLVGEAQAKSGSSSVSTLDVGSTLDILDGDLLVALVGHGNASTTISMAASSGTPDNALTFDAEDYEHQDTNDNHLTFGYRLSGATRSGITFRVTLGASRQFVTVIIYQFRNTALCTITKDGSAKGNGTGTALASGNISTTGTDNIVFGSYSDYDGFSISSLQIGGVAADGSTTVTGTQWSAWYRRLTATASNINSTATLSTSGKWIGNIIAFKARSVEVAWIQA